MSKRADKKENQQNKANFTEEMTNLTAKKADDYVPSLNNISKNEQ